MKEKQVIINYNDYEEMLTRLQNLEKSKLCLLNINIEEYTYGSISNSSIDFNINTEKELDTYIKNLIDKYRLNIENPLENTIKLLQDQNNRMRLELNKYTNKKWYKFWN